MKYAFVHRNFRSLSFEKKTIFLSHLITVVACFFPWLSTHLVRGEVTYFSAFSGPAFLMGSVVFLISFCIVIFFADQLFDRRKLQLGFSEIYLYSVSGAQQCLLLILMWSVLASSGCGFDSEVRFGLFLSLIVQIAGLVATFLEWQQSQQQEARSFFQHPSQSPSTPPAQREPSRGLFEDHHE